MKVAFNRPMERFVNIRSEEHEENRDHLEPSCETVSSVNIPHDIGVIAQSRTFHSYACVI